MGGVREHGAAVFGKVYSGGCVSEGKELKGYVVEGDWGCVGVKKNLEGRGGGD